MFKLLILTVSSTIFVTEAASLRVGCNPCDSQNSGTIWLPPTPPNTQPRDDMIWLPQTKIPTFTTTSTTRAVTTKNSNSGNNNNNNGGSGLVTGGQVNVPSASGLSPVDFRRLHSSVRAQVGLSELTWDDRLAASAYAYISSSTVCRSNPGPLAHSDANNRKLDGRRVGENLWRGQSSIATTSRVFHDWFSERWCYRYGPIGNSCITKCDSQCSTLSRPNDCQQGHFAQVMWHRATSIGCAAHQCPQSGLTSVACHYASSTGSGGVIGIPFDETVAARLGLHTSPCSGGMSMLYLEETSR